MRLPFARSISLLFCLGWLAGWSVQTVTAAETEGAPADPVLLLCNGDLLSGRLVDSQGSRLLWQAAAFDGPLSFNVSAVSAVQFPASQQRRPPQGTYHLELSGHDSLFGELRLISAEEAVIDVPNVGELHIDRARLRRISLVAGAVETLLDGPGRLQDWSSSGPAESFWRQEAGHLVTDQAGAQLDRDVRLPERARLELELTWKDSLDIELSLGTGNAGKKDDHPFRFEVWDRQLVVQRETEKDGDLAVLQEIKPGAGRIQLQIYLDQKQGRMLVYGVRGDLLAELKVVSQKPVVQGGIRLVNKTGDVRLERLRISPWSADTPQVTELNKTRWQLADGSILYGDLKSYLGDDQGFLVATAGGDQTLPKDRVSEVVLFPERELAACSLQAIQNSGQRISGDLEKVEGNAFWLKSPGIREPLPLAMDQCMTLIGLQPQTDVPPLSGRPGRLESAGIRLQGCLIDGQETDANCLVWQPTFSQTARPLKPGVPIQVTYRDRPPPPKPNDSQVLQQQLMNQQANARRRAQNDGIIRRKLVKEEPKPATANSPAHKSVLHLRSGDIIPCTVTGIDEKGVSIATNISAAALIPHAQLKVVELEARAPAVAMAKSKKNRLLMLPRMQRDSPPTQLVRAVNGDYLRGRVISLDDRELQIEVRLDTRIVPRNRVVRIIWLHADEISADVNPPPAGNSAPPADAATAKSMRVQALQTDGNRLTMEADRFEKGTLSGRSVLLGPCQVEIDRVDQLLIGDAIEQAAASLAFHQWRLRAAPDPLDPDPDGDGSGDGLESKLVGQPAPAVELTLLGGGKFRLADHKQKIVILDFWATWCGPCVATLPMIDGVAREFADQGVEFFAVNLEEAPDRIQGFLRRLRLETAVALDIDGLTAEKYHAQSIPQTVIVNREGKVARLFVGGGDKFEEKLRAALKSLLEDPPAP